MPTKHKPLLSDLTLDTSELTLLAELLAFVRSEDSGSDFLRAVILDYKDTIFDNEPLSILAIDREEVFTMTVQ